MPVLRPLAVEGDAATGLVGTAFSLDEEADPTALVSVGLLATIADEVLGRLDRLAGRMRRRRREARHREDGVSLASASMSASWA
jgi:hypothetical protein